MYAVVEIAGQQFKVAKADRIHVPKLESEIGSKLKFEKVLLLGDDKQTRIGTPYLSGSVIEAKDLVRFAQLLLSLLESVTADAAVPVDLRGSGATGQDQSDGQ